MRASERSVTTLEDDHSTVEKLFKRYKKVKNADDKARFELAPQIFAMTVHGTKRMSASERRSAELS
jgi:hypothetical protein